MQLKQGNPLERVPAAERSELLALSRRLTFKRDALLFRQGEPGSAFFIVDSGTARTFFTAGDGSEFTIGFWKSGDLCGTADMAAERRALSAVAETKVVAYEFAPADLGRLMAQCPMFCQELFRALSFKIRWTSMIAANLATKSASQRLAEILRALAEIDGTAARGGRIVLNRRFSQEELALMAGCTRQWVSQQMAVLRQRGALSTTTPDGRWVIDPARLARFGQGGDPGPTPQRGRP